MQSLSRFNKSVYFFSYFATFIANKKQLYYLIFIKSRNTTLQNTRGQKRVRPSELETAHSHNETERGARVSEP